jgi:hypothetical protein
MSFGRPSHLTLAPVAQEATIYLFKSPASLGPLRTWGVFDSKPALGQLNINGQI